MAKHITVAICDDERCVINALEEILNVYSFHLSEKWNLNIQKYTDPQLLLKSIDDIKILFLDIEMPKINGFELSREIRKRKIDTKIIFLTSHDEYMQKAFEVKAFRYLKKPFVFQDIEGAMNSALEEFEEEGILVGGVYVSLNDIYYFKVQGDATTIITKTDQIISHISLHLWEENLYGNFSRPHRSFLVHLMYVAHINKKDVTIKNGDMLPVSHRNQGKFRADYDNYILRKANIF